MTETRRKLFGIFNPRPLFIAPLYLIAGILLAVLRPPFVGVWFCCLALSALYLYAFKILSTNSFVIVLICLCLSLTTFVYPVYLNSKLCHDSSAQAEGRILEAYTTENGYEYLLDDLTVNGESYAGKMRLITSVSFESGERIYIKGTLHTASFNMNIYTLRRISRKEYYSFSISEIHSVFYQGLPFREKLLDEAKRGLQINADYQTASFAMSLLFGKSKDLESISAYRETSLAHLFAVSGLHVGTLTGALYFILTKVFRRRRGSIGIFATLTVSLGFYAFLCDFTPSVVRALVMTLIAALSKPLKFEPDKPSVIGASAIISLAINPLWLFDVSFLLSYAAILGIVLLKPIFKRGLAREKESRIAVTAATCLAVTVAVTPVNAYFFGQASPLSLPLSLIFIPFVSFLFICFALVLPFVGLSLSVYPLIPLSLGVKLCDYVVNFLDKTDAYVKVEYGVLPLILWFIALFLASDLCLIKRRKIPAALCGFGAAIALLFV